MKHYIMIEMAEQPTQKICELINKDICDTFSYLRYPDTIIVQDVAPTKHQSKEELDSLVVGIKQLLDSNDINYHRMECCIAKTLPQAITTTKGIPYV